MTFSGKLVTATIAAVLTSAASLPASSTDDAVNDPAPATQASAASVAAPIVTIPQMPVVETPAPAPAVVAVSAAADQDADEETASNEIDADLECLAKVVLHEAGNQSRAGQIAVAEVVMNRLQDPRGRFGRSICGVVLQRGQFFNVNAYRPHRDSRWPRVVAIAREVRDDMIDGDHDEVTNGGLFFRNNSGAQFRGRVRTATIGDHHFYR